MIPKLKQTIKYIRNEIYIPDEIINSTHFKILHLSDTPSPVYKALIRMVTELKPDMVIHTGDIADDIKLDTNPGCLNYYTSIVEPFLRKLVQNVPDTLLIPGNHDYIPFIERIISPPAKVLRPGSVIHRQGHAFGAAHSITDLPDHAQFMLYGHNFDIPADSGDTVFLNGVASINIVLLPSRMVFSTRYPLGTDYYRKYKAHPKLI